MTSSIFVDSSILVEKLKERRIELYDRLAHTVGLTLCINQTVLSEFTFHLLAVEGGKAPLTLKRDGSIPAIISQSDPTELLGRFLYLESDQSIIPLYLRYMQQYNMLPNDALILATCKLSGIDQIASYDSDFATACAGEGIQLIQAVADLTA